MAATEGTLIAVRAPRAKAIAATMADRPIALAMLEHLIEVAYLEGVRDVQDGIIRRFTA